jgi:TPR repeat protein
MKPTLCVLLLISGLALAAAGDYQLGLSAYERGDFAEALDQWLPLAQRGDAEAQYRVGRLYYYGRGVEQNYAQAGEWYLQAAEQGHARSQSNVGVMYEEGRGFPANDEEAARWYAKAAEQGRAVSQNNLGRMYEEGRGVERSDSRAAELYAAAAKNGNAEAQYRLGRMYETGKGVTQDSKKAQKWYRKASDNGYDVPTAASRTSAEAPVAPQAEATATGAAAATSIAIEDDATTDDSPAVAGPTPAPEATGTFDEGVAAYDRGDYRTAADLWRPLAESGDAEAQFRLGELHRLGQGVPEDPATAGRWHLAAAEQGHPHSMYYVALMYYRGRGGDWEKDYVRAYVWFTLAAEKGIGDATWWRDRLGAKMSDRETAESKKLLADLDKN